ncbi:MAG: GFA family protein [Erythrobacter sp.]
MQFAAVTGFPELTTCDCSICVRKNALMVKVHESDFELIAGEGALVEYQFHTQTARHFFCSTCGIYPFHRKRVTPDFVGINVYCLEGFDPEGIPVRATNGKEMD